MATAKTNSLKQLDLVNTLDPRLKCLEYSQEKLEYGVVKGASYSNFQQQKANSYSQSGISFNFNTQGSSTMIDRRVYCQCQFQVSFKGTPSAGTKLLNDDLHAPRAYPLANVTENLTVTINGTSVSSSYADALQALLRYNTNYDLENYDLSGTPTFLDNFENYQDGFQTVRNPLGTYANSGYKQTGRGSFKMDSVVNPEGNGTDEVTAVVRFTVVEPILLSPMSYSSQHLDSALIGVNNLAVQYNFSNLERVWSYVDGSDIITDVSVQIGSGVTEIPQLLVNYLNTPLVDEAKIPKTVVYDYFQLDTFQNDQNVTMSAGQTSTFTNNSIQLSVIPRSIWIYCAVPRGTKTAEDTDSFFKINSISLQYLNVSGQFSSATINDLYNMSVKNGLKMSFQEFSGSTNSYFGDVPLCGSVIRIDSSDLALGSNLASGVPANSQLQFTINVTNQSNSSRPVSIYTVVGNEGLMSILENTMMTQVSVLSQEDVLNAREKGEFRDEDLHQSIYGGSFLGRVRNVLKKFSREAKRLGLDKIAKEEAKRLIENKMMGKGLVGGQQMTRKQLKEMMSD